MASKIIVIGGTNGQYSTVLSKLTTLHSKNAFALAIVAGDFFADPAAATDADEANIDSLLNGTTTVPLPTYFTVGRHPLPPRIIEKLSSSANEVCENLYYLGKRTTLTTSEGIKIVCLGGLLDTTITAGVSKDTYTPFHTEDDAKSLRGANTADILLTTVWPASITTGSNIPLPNSKEPIQGQQSISDLCAALKPRYHFSTTPTFTYEREPFSHPAAESTPDQRAVTRFISLASYGNPTKQKWVYAFSLDPAAPLPTPSTLPPGTTATPFAKKRSLPAQSQEYSRFGHTSNHHHNKRARRAPPPGPQECFFCLSNPNLATHLIASIGTDCYLTTAKGPLTTSSSSPDLSFPSHILIIPLSHSPTLSSIPDPDARRSTLNEMRRYRTALHSMLQSKADGRLGAVTWEVSRAAGIHTHWQLLPVATDLLRKGLVEAAFRVQAENDKYPAFTSHSETDSTEDVESDERGDFFRVWLWSPPSSDSDSPNTQTAVKVLTLPLTDKFRFDLQFGRRVLAKLLGLEARLQWKDCGQTVAEETQDVEAFKAAFKDFDFSLDE